jgi:hypothetical protein
MCWAVAAWRAGSSAAPHGNARPQFCLFLQHDDPVPLAGRGQRQLEAGRSTAQADGAAAQSRCAPDRIVQRQRQDRVMPIEDMNIDARVP